MGFAEIVTATVWSALFKHPLGGRPATQTNVPLNLPLNAGVMYECDIASIHLIHYPAASGSIEPTVGIGIHGRTFL
jgi:hypothetical protein